MRLSFPELEALAREWRRAPEIVGEELTAAMEKAVLDAEGEISDRAPRDRGTLAGGIAGIVVQVDHGVRGIVTPRNVPYAFYQDQGTVHGVRMPPIALIREWVIRKGLFLKAADFEPYLKKGKTKDQAFFAAKRRFLPKRQAEIDSIAWAVATAIKKRGVPATHFFERGAKAAEPAIRSRFRGALVRVNKRLGRRP